MFSITHSSMYVIPTQYIGYSKYDLFTNEHKILPLVLTEGHGLNKHSHQAVQDFAIQQMVRIRQLG